MAGSTTLPPVTPQMRRNQRVGFVCLAVVASMVGVAYASVPLYEMFCQATGYGGTTQTSAGNPKGVIARPMTVRFDSNIDSGLNWTIVPSKPITDDIGKVDTVNFVATNNSDHAVTGQAIFNVSPERAGLYFNKIECFCFTEQTLQPGETVEMPIVFFVDPDLAQNAELDTLKELTLSYTFYPVNKGS